MIKETEHFVLDYRKIKDHFGNPVTISADNGLRVCAKNIDGTMTEILLVLPNKQLKFMEDPGSYIETFGTRMQDTVKQEWWPEFVQVLDEADYRVGLAIVGKDFNTYLD